MTHRTLSQILAELTTLNKVIFLTVLLMNGVVYLIMLENQNNSIEPFKKIVLSSIKDKRLEGASLIWYKVLSGGLLLHKFFHNFH